MIFLISKNSIGLPTLNNCCQFFDMFSGLTDSCKVVKINKKECQRSLRKSTSRHLI